MRLSEPTRCAMNGREQMQQTVCAVARLFDDLIGGHEQFVWQGEAEHTSSLGIDDQLELGRLHDRQVRRLRALEDAAGIGTHLTIRIRQAGSVTHQPADLGILTPRIYCGNRVARRQLGQLDTSADEKGAGAEVEGVGPLAYKVCEGRVDLAAGAGAEDLEL